FDAHAWGADPFGYHLENLILYLFAVAGLYVLIIETARSFPSRHPLSETALIATAAVGTFLFLVHPAHVEAVAWIAGRSDLLSAVTYVWAMAALARFWLKRRPACAIAGVTIFAIGLFLKENVITLPAVFWLYAAFSGDIGKRWREFLAISAPLVGLVLLWTV